MTKFTEGCVCNFESCSYVFTEIIVGCYYWLDIAIFQLIWEFWLSILTVSFWSLFISIVCCLNRLFPFNILLRFYLFCLRYFVIFLRHQQQSAKRHLIANLFPTCIPFSSFSKVSIKNCFRYMYVKNLYYYYYLIIAITH